MEETTTNETPRENEQPASAIHELVATGLGWAQYGLAMGQHSLQASARTLETAATFLAQLSDRLAPSKPER
jgi:hypothetical protein